MSALMPLVDEGQYRKLLQVRVLFRWITCLIATENRQWFYSR